MSFLSVVPDAVTAASGNLQEIASALRTANAAATAQTTAIAAPAADEVSAAVTEFFSSSARQFQSLNAQAAVFHDNFVSLLSGGAARYLNTEAANAQRTVVDAVNGPAQALLGRPLIGPGSVTAAAANPAQAFSSSETQFIPTPFGPVYLTIASGGDLDNAGNGTFWQSGSAVTPLGPFHFSVNGNATMSGVGSSVAQVTGGTLYVPPQIALLAAMAGPYVTGGYSLVNSANTFSAALGHGDYLGAAVALVTAPSNYETAMLFGHQTVTVPLGSLSDSGDPINFHIPFGGVFAGLEPASMSWPQGSISDPSSPTAITVLPSEFPLQGTRFGGFVPTFFNALLNAIGISL